MIILDLEEIKNYLLVYFYIFYYFPPGTLPLRPHTLILFIILLLGLILASIPLIYHAFKLYDFTRYSKMWQPWKKLSLGWAMIIIAGVTGIIEFIIILFSGILDRQYVSWSFISIMVIPLMIPMFFTIILTSMGIRQFYLNASVALNPGQEINKMRYVIVIHKHSSVTVYDKKLGDWKFNPLLIGGFINALQSLSFEIKDVDIPMKKMEYEDFDIIMEQGKHCIAALFIDGQESDWLREKLANFISEFESDFKDKFKNWSGDLTDFKKSEILIDRIFELYRISK